METLTSERRRPRALTPGARIGLVAPAGPLDAEGIDRACDRCRTLGWDPVVFPAASSRSGFLAGTDAERLGDLQAALDAPEIDAVWALRGGYGTMRIVDRLDLSRQDRDPVPFIGFSDNTALHVRHARQGVVSFHGPHAAASMTDPAKDWLFRVLTSDDPPGMLPLPEGARRPRALVPGHAHGRLFGGNLALLAALCGSPDSVSARGCILCVEDVGEPAYRLDRMLVQLRRSGVTEGVVGLALGRFTGVPGDQEDLANEVVESFAQVLGVPAVVDLPFGHVDGNMTLPLGVAASLDADGATLSLEEPAVRVG